MFTDNNTGKTYGREQSLKVKDGAGFTIKSNGTLGEKISRIGSDFVAPFLEVPQDIIFPLVNQFNVVINEGFHEGRAYNSSNYILPNTYQFENWSFVKGQSTTSTGTPTWEEGKEKINNTINVTPLGIQTKAGIFVDNIIETIIKIPVTESINKIE